jgi:hypothetical protein
MKLREKLADGHYKNFAGDNPTVGAIIVEKLAKEFYDAGFRKARDMILALSGNLPGRSYHDAEMVEAIASLGEEEV